MPTRAETNARASALRAGFEAAGAVAVEPPILQPAGALLDLYGEDIRARAYVTSDPLRGEQMLRPDFTVPVVQMHMAGGAEPARYTYAGEVFRRQEDDAARANEYVQVGYEVFDRADPAGADAEVFARIAGALAHVPTRAVVGDVGLLMAAVEGLSTTETRKAALRRHLWRPRRFRQLLEMFAGRIASPPTRAALLRGEIETQAPHVGKRRGAEIEARINALRIDARAPALDAREVDLIEGLLDIAMPLPDALSRLHDLCVDMPAISGAVEGLDARRGALETRGVDVRALTFEASYGRTSMEYYDGFVFGLRAEARPDLPPLATGGRYDALTRRLGAGAEIPAVGGVMRPGPLIEVEEAATC
ncbi:ATP phosphoribosyltransferase regulatory subunit [Sulfitobacter albidus]|uniref:ATP phosphoribosyltransferase regulatory subunit n=1 Tax=Sulfitobacter albidus TaxID=2829501 RepID=A0A975PMI8_9RHOB|nr:ATP phosphoribosyltransferase regulatory subunit [Sulfitobacter albidus]QUJ76848.1 ATP phosphoribosyltransferase regulatory subunit [Sulfitobacter albidus]